MSARLMTLMVVSNFRDYTVHRYTLQHHPSQEHLSHDSHKRGIQLLDAQEHADYNRVGCSTLEQVGREMLVPMMMCTRHHGTTSKQEAHLDDLLLWRDIYSSSCMRSVKLMTDDNTNSYSRLPPNAFGLLSFAVSSLRKISDYRINFSQRLGSNAWPNQEHTWSNRREALAS